MTLPIKTNRLEAEPFLRNQPHLNGPHPSCAGSENTIAKVKRPNSGTPWAIDRLDLPQPLTDQFESLQAFSVLVIKQDRPDGTGDGEPLHQAILQAMDKKADLFWSGHWKESLYVMLLPNLDTVKATEHARDIQTALGLSRPETISIGVAIFPLLDFTPNQTIGNGGKALDHAAFFGPGKIVVFDAVSLNISGDQYYQDGDMDRAVAEYHTALQIDPGNANVLNSLGVCMARKGDLTGAHKFFESAWQNDDTEAMAAYNLAILQLIDNAPEKALPLLKQAVALNHECYDIPFRLGKLLYEQNAHREALVHLNSAIALREDSAIAHYYLGECLARTAQPKAAIAALSRAVKLNPTNAAALSTLGILYAVRNENPEICETFFQQSIALDPKEGTFHHRLGRFYQKQNQWEQALAAFEEAQALGHRCHKHMAQVRQKLSDRGGKDMRCA